MIAVVIFDQVKARLIFYTVCIIAEINRCERISVIKKMYPLHHFLDGGGIRTVATLTLNRQALTKKSTAERHLALGLANLKKSINFRYNTSIHTLSTHPLTTRFLCIYSELVP